MTLQQHLDTRFAAHLSRKHRVAARLQRLGMCLAQLALVVFSGATALQAQVDTGAIVGTVTDNTGAAIPGATIRLLEEHTGRQIMQGAGKDGTYTFSPLALGTYTLTVEKEGFKTSVRQHIEVTVQSNLNVNPRLETGAVTESVQVSSATPLLDTAGASMQQLVTEQQIDQLPLNGRNATQLAQLSPGVAISQNDSRGLQASGSFTANGTRRTQNNYLLDGLDDNSNIADLVSQAQFVILPPPDALREFAVQTSNYTAEFGHSAGAVLNVSTKGGTNTLHGDIWEYLRNDYFDAKDFFVPSTQRKPEFRQNQFGAAIGGPVVIPHLYNGRNRSFFFGDYQGTRVVQGRTYNVTVPTVAESASNFTNLSDLIALQSGTKTDALGRVFPLGTVFDPATTRALTANGVDAITGIKAAAAGYVRDPFYSGSLRGVTIFTGPANVALLNQLPVARLNPNAVKLLQLYPTPTTAGLTNNFTDSPANSTVLDAFDVRFDQIISTKDTAFARYGFLHQTQVIPGPFAGIADGAASRPGSGRTESQNMALSETHIFTTHVVNEARVGYTRAADRRLQVGADTLGIPQQYGIPGIPQLPGNGGLPNFTFGQLANLGSAGSLPSDKESEVFQVTENVTLDLGRHQVRTGFEYQHIALPSLTPASSRGVFGNSGIYTSVVSNVDGSTDRAQFVLAPGATTVAGGINNLGGSNTVTASAFSPVFFVQRQYFAGYAEDSWRPIDKVTLNFGVRYEYFGVNTDRDNRYANVVPASQGTEDGLSHFYIPQSQVANIPQVFLTQLALDKIVFTPEPDGHLATPQHTNFAPRLGFSVQATPRLVLRGGYGLFFQGDENLGIAGQPPANYPFSLNVSYTAGSAVTPLTANNTVGPISQGLSNVALSPTTIPLAAVPLIGRQRNPRTSYAQDYNLQVQYQVTPNTIAFAGYVGSGSRHVQVNPTTNGYTSIAAPAVNSKTLLTFPDFAAGGTFLANIGESNYNSLQVGGEHRFSHGLSATANFTYSKCMGDTRDLLDNNVGGYRAPYIAGVGINADYTLCDIDTRRTVHLSSTYELPFGKGRSYLTSGVAAYVVGGWSTNFIFQGQDGQPFSVACSGVTTTSGLGCFALKVPGQNPYAGSHNYQQFLNPAAFVNPPVATAGNASLANLGGPGAQVSGPPFRRLDFSLVRRFTTFHEQHLEFRAECFNITNTPNLAQPGSLTFTSPSSFASISSTRDNPNDPRQIQLSGKYYF